MAVSDKKVLLIVGNGLTISFWETHPAKLRDWHPSKPLSFPVPTPGKESEPLLENLPRLRAALDEARLANAGASDFELLRDALAISRRAGQTLIEVEARHFLTLAYSHLHWQLMPLLEADRDVWAWRQWIRQHGAAALHVVSFNYELLFEMAILFTIGRRIQPQDGAGPGRAVVFKPHGSINYETAGITGLSRSISYPLEGFIGWNDAPVNFLDPADLVKARVEPVAVLPHEHSMYTSAEWNKRGFYEYTIVAPQATHVVIVGISYALADRAEIDFFLDHLRIGAHVHVVDPYPSADLLEAIRRRGHTPIVSSGPPAVFS